MLHHFLNNAGNNNLIIFFSGWSFDYKPFECINSSGYDVLMYYDYSSLDGILPNLQNKYKTITLAAWSMGVYIAYYFRDKLPEFTEKIAINGTPYPINDTYGIPRRIFNLTLRHAETGLQRKFYENVFANEKFLEKYLKHPVERTIQNRVKELESLDKLIKSNELQYDNKFYTRAIVGRFDKIIPPENQINCWQDKAVKLDCGHFPFYCFKSWDEILKCR